MTPPKMAASCRKRFILLTCIFYFCSPSVVTAWDSDDFELFDTVEDVGRNFYEVLGIEQSASQADIRRAYRKLSLQLHPDKNKEEDAETKFRQLVAVYEVLKDEEKRKRYHLVLENGLPDWRQPIFYYRRVRKMGLLEFFVVICTITTVGQYIVMWSVYAERKFTLSENFGELRRKAESKNRKVRQEIEDKIDKDLERLMEAVPKPRFLSLWPFLLALFLVRAIRNSPETVRQKYEEWKQQRAVVPEEEEDEDEDEDDDQEEKKKRRRARAEYNEPASVVLAEGTPVVYTQIINRTEEPGDDGERQLKKGEWTDEEVALLTKAANKYPGGTAKRWDKIAEMVGRSKTEVIKKCEEIKDTHTMNLDVSVQGGVPKGGKKLQSLTDDIISVNTDLCQKNMDLNSSDPQLRKRHKPTKKTADRTLLITQGDATGAKKDIPKNSSVEEGKESQSGADNCDKSEGALKLSEDSDGWNKNQQTILEWALRQYPKGTEQRWEKIAEHIPGKSKDDCVARFKYLAELVKKKKESQASSNKEN